MVDPISLAILAKIGAAVLGKVGVLHATTTAATVVGGAAVSVVTSIAIVASCYVIENFAKNAAVKARAAGVRKFFVWVLKESWGVVKFVAQSSGGQWLASDTTSWDSLSSGAQQQLDANGGSFTNQYQV
jgi:hypothetical protein